MYKVKDLFLNSQLYDPDLLEFESCHQFWGPDLPAFHNALNVLKMTAFFFNLDVKKLLFLA